MNSSQKITILIALVALFTMVLVPPWRPTAEYALVFAPPSEDVAIDVQRLAFQCLLVLIFAGALFLVFKPEPTQGLSPTEDPEAVPSSPAVPAAQNKLAKQVTIGFIAASIIVLIAYLYAQMDKDATRREQTAEQMKVIVNKKMDDSDTVRKVSSAVAERQREIAVEQAERYQELKKLATAKTWPPRPTQTAGVTAHLHTYWKDNYIYYRFQLNGRPDPLEIAAPQGRVFTITLKDSDGIGVVSVSISASDLRGYKNRAGALSYLESDNAIQQCSEEVYRSIAGWDVVPSE